MYAYDHVRPAAPASRGTWRLFVPGASLIGFGLLVLVLPQVLVALVAAGLLSAGFFALAAAWKVRKLLEAPPTLYVDAAPPFATRPFSTPVEEWIYRFYA